MKLTDAELEIIIQESLIEAELELSDSGKSLNISCDFKNGNTNTCSSYSKQIDQDSFTQDDILRHERLSKLCGLSA